MNRTIVGRSTAPLVSIRGYSDDDTGFDEMSFELKGATVRSEAQGKFRIESKHEDGTDFEHDASYVALFDGAGLMMKSMYENMISFSGYLYAAKFYPEGFEFKPGVETPHSSDNDVIEVCDDTDYYHPEGCDWPAGHLLMPYQPPVGEGFKPFMADITVHYGTR